MSAMTHARRFVFYQVQLGRDELDHLISLATEGIRSPHIQVGTQRYERSFYSTDLDSLLRDVRKLCGPQSPTKWTRLTWKASGPDHTARLKFQKNCLTVEFQSSDATWTTERERDVTYYLRREAKAKEEPLHPAILRWLIPLALVLAFAFSWGELGLWPVVRENSQNHAADMGLSILLAASIFGGYALHRRLRTITRRESRTEVDVKHPRPPQRPLLRMMVPDWASAIVASLIAAVATLAAILALIATGF
ncbi:hypothetical protein AB0J38_21855 [Streptomyces sp. NPDC050095]|uniref:hypothetical protein n=1 Tax=unclassified Streptomyces TaxID=2593676 RepID=UPI00344941A9